MVVETYLRETAAPEITPEEKDGLLDLVHELGLKGQQTLVEGSSDTDIVPFRPMTAEEENVYATILPEHEKLELYEQEVIPLRVLEVAKRAREDGTGKVAHLFVWYSTTMKDPILVGRQESYSGQLYLLARWGDELESFPKLKAKAALMLLPRLTAKLKTAITALQGVEPKTRVEQFLNGDRANVDPYVSGI